MTPSHGDRDGSSAQVDATLERHLDDVAFVVHDYLDTSGEPERRALEQAIAHLDGHAARSDAYGRSFLDAPFLGYSGKGDVIGATGSLPFVELVPRAVLNAQITLVQRARDELSERSLTSMHALASAMHDLEALRPSASD